MPKVETERRRRWTGSDTLIAGGNTGAVPVDVEELRWNRLLKTALPTEPLRGRFMLLLELRSLVVSLLDMMGERKREPHKVFNRFYIVRPW